MARFVGGATARKIPGPRNNVTFYNRRLFSYICASTPCPSSAYSAPAPAPAPRLCCRVLLSEPRAKHTADIPNIVAKATGHTARHALPTILYNYGQLKNVANTGDGIITCQMAQRTHTNESLGGNGKSSQNDSDSKAAEKLKDR